MTASPLDAPAIAVADHLKWARAVARGVRSFYGFQPGGQEERDLEQVAFLTMTAKAKQFNPERVPSGGDPAGAFRGWAHPSIRCQCRREAVRLLNGGTYSTRRDQTVLTVQPLPVVKRLVDLGNDVYEECPLYEDGRRWFPVDLPSYFSRLGLSADVPEMRPDLVLATVMTLPPRAFEDPEERRFWHELMHYSGFGQDTIRLVNALVTGEKLVIKVRGRPTGPRRPDLRRKRKRKYQSKKKIPRSEAAAQHALFTTLLENY